MSDISRLIDNLQAAGVPAEAILIAVRAVAEQDEQRKAEARGRKAKQRISLKNGHGTVTGQSRDQSSAAPPKDNNQNPHTTSKEEEGPSVPLVDRQKSDLAEAVAIFNHIAGKTGWAKADKLTDVRKGKLRGRIKDAGGLAGWNGAIERAAQSSFLNGDNDKGWKPGFDFFLSQEKFIKLLEGTYDNRGQNRRVQSAGPRESPYVAILHGALAAEYRAGGDGIPGGDGDYGGSSGRFDDESRSDRGLFAGLASEPINGSGLNVIDLVPIKGSRS